MAAPTAAMPPAEVSKFFADVKAAIRKHPTLVAEIAGIFCFVIRGGGPKGNDIAFCYTVDLKNAPGDVVSSPAPTRGADCTLEYKTASDFVAINNGKMDLKKAIFTGKLKLQGNVKVLQRMHECMEAARKREAAEEARKKQMEEEARNRARAPSYAAMPAAMHAAAMSAVASGAGAGAGAMGSPASVMLGINGGSINSGAGSDDRGSVRSEASGADPHQHHATGSSASGSSGSSGKKRMSLVSVGAQIRGAFTASTSPLSSSSPAAPQHQHPVPAPGGQIMQWQSDDSAKDCTRCQAPFGIVRRRHHCRNCGRLFCQKCSSRNVEVPGASSARRFCDFCMERVYRAPPADGLRIPDPAFSLSNRLAVVAGAGSAGTVGIAPAPGGLPQSVHSQPQLLPHPQGAPASAAAAPAATNNSPRFSVKGGIKSLFSYSSSSSLGKQQQRDQRASSLSFGDSSQQTPARPPSGSISSVTDGSPYPYPHPHPHLHAQGHMVPSSAGSAAPLAPEAIVAVPAPAVPNPAGSSASTVVLASREAVEEVVLGLGLTKGDDNQQQQQQQQQAQAELQSKVDDLERKLLALQQELARKDTVPELVTPDHSLGSLLARAELSSAIMMPFLFAVALMGWRVVPAVIAYYAAGALMAGRWFWFLVYAGVAGWIVHGGYSTSNSAELFRRRMRVYGSALVAFLDYRLTRYSVASAGYDERDAEAEAIWEAAHRRNAVRLFRIIKDLRGLWVKCGQFLSSRPDVMPGPYVSVLSALQDSMPARPLKEVQESIEEQLKRPINQVFASLEDKALAAASVGQVHRGRLRPELGGAVVAVKVQHKGMDTIISQDLDNLNIILSWLSYVEVGFDLKGVMSEWLKEVLSELDFTLEAKNMMEVRQNLQRTDITVTIPRVIPGLVGKGVLVMRFIEGIKVNDKDRLDKLVGENKDVLVSRISRSFAHQIYRDGKFSADPHPGNIFVARLQDLVAGDKGDDTGEHQRLVRVARERRHKRALKAAAEASTASPATPSKAQLEDLADLSDLADEWVPVLIDFGLCKRLPDHLRLAFGKLVISAEEVDFAAMLEAMDDMGMTFSTEAAGQDLENLQAMFQNAVPASEAKSAAAEKERQKKEKEEKEKAEKEKEGDTAGAAAAANRKVTAWPPELMMFLRTSQILTGVASYLETRHPFMHTMAAAARMARLDAYYKAEPGLLMLTAAAAGDKDTESAGSVPSTPQAYYKLHRLPAVLPPLPLPQPQLQLLDAEAVTSSVQQLLKGGMKLPSAAPPNASTPAASKLEARLRKRLAKLHRAGAFQGCQVVVIRRPVPSDAENGNASSASPSVVLSLSAGTCGHLDPRPVTPATLFPALGASRVGVAAATAHLASALSLDLDTARVGEFWPAFASAADGSKAACSVGELLRCRSGIETVCPPNLSTGSLTRAQWSEGSEAVAKARPLLLPRIAAAVHGKPLPSSSPSGGGGWGALMGPSSSSSAGDSVGAPADSSSGSDSSLKLDDAADALSPVSHNESDDDDDDDDDEESVGDDDHDGEEGSTHGSASARKKPSHAPLPALAEDVDTAANDEAEAEAEGDKTTPKPELKPSPKSKSKRAVALVPAKPAFAEVPAKLVDCFYRDSAAGMPSVGPDVDTEQTAHLFFGYGWAVGEVVAGMAARLGGGAKTKDETPAAAAANALTTFVSSSLERAMGLRGHVAFGVQPLQSAATKEEEGLVGGVTSHASDRVASLCLGGSGALEGIVFSDDSEGEEVNGSSDAKKDVTDEDDSGDDEDHLADGDAPNEITMAAAMAAMEHAEALTVGGLNDLTSIVAKGREHFLDPRLVNIRKLRCLSQLPSMGLYCSAMGLAYMLDYAVATHVRALHRSMMASSSSSSGADAATRQWREAVKGIRGDGAAEDDTASLAFTCEDPTTNAGYVTVTSGGAKHVPRRRALKSRLLDLRALWAAHYSGMRLVAIKKKATQGAQGKGSLAKHTLVSGVGCGSLGGSATVVTDVASGVTVAVTLNRITSDRALSRALVRMVFEELELGTPSSSDL